MKVVVFQGGLGNQIYQYVFSQYLAKRYPNDKIYGFYPRKELKDHNGLEILKWFDIKLPSSCYYVNLLTYVIFYFNKIMRRLNLPLLFTNNDWAYKEDALIHDGFWQDKRFVLESGCPSFRSDLKLSEKNLSLLDMISSHNSVAVHVRRGDYMSSINQKKYGGICDLAYYKKAIDIIERSVKDPYFFIFSDDTAYVKANFNLPNMIVVDHNKGDNSFFDMFLMSHCKNMILANSTFSCWSAYMNSCNGTIICPSKWRNDRPSPDILLENWIKI